MNIGAASEASGASRRMIRHYEKIGLIPSPPRRDSGFPIEEIRTLLDLWSDRHRTSAEVKALAEARATDLGRKAEALQAMRKTVLDLAARCHGDSRPDCPIIERLEQ